VFPVRTGFEPTQAAGSRRLLFRILVGFPFRLGFLPASAGNLLLPGGIEFE
jgi:hypothetical protein